jgi:hypothetical protein
MKDIPSVSGWNSRQLSALNPPGTALAYAFRRQDRTTSERFHVLRKKSTKLEKVLDKSSSKDMMFAQVNLIVADERGNEDGRGRRAQR